jgi:hypothetical protein
MMLDEKLVKSVDGSQEQISFCSSPMDRFSSKFLDFKEKRV